MRLRWAPKPSPHFTARRSLGEGHVVLLALGFIPFFCWLASRERAMDVKVACFLRIMELGNITMSRYMPIELFHLGADDGLTGWFRQNTA